MRFIYTFSSNIEVTYGESDSYMGTTNKELDVSGPDPNTAGSIHSLDKIDPYPEITDSNIRSSNISNASQVKTPPIDISDYPKIPVKIDVSDYYDTAVDINDYSRSQTSPKETHEQVDSQSGHSVDSVSEDDYPGKSNKSFQNSKSSLEGSENADHVSDSGESGEYDDYKVTSNISPPVPEPSVPDLEQGRGVENVSVQDYKPVIINKVKKKDKIRNIYRPSQTVALPPEIAVNDEEADTKDNQNKTGYLVTDRCQTGDHVLK